MHWNQEPDPRVEHLNWDLYRPAPKSVFFGWVIGPYIGLATHFNRASRPCVQKLTYGEVVCKHCELGEAHGWTAWLPLVSESGRKTVVMFSRQMKDAVDRLNYGDPVSVRKGPHNASVVVIKSEPWISAPCPYLGRLKVQANIQEYLLRLWGMEALKNRDGYEMKSLSVPERIKPAAEPAESIRATMDREMAKRYPIAPSKNGKHKRPEAN
jgi:hypothetical protein